jgi:hypothetical protein
MNIMKNTGLINANGQIQPKVRVFMNYDIMSHSHSS